MKLDTHYFTEVLQRLIATPSPVGDTSRGIELCRELLCALDLPDLQLKISPKGTLTATIEGRNTDKPRAVTAHVDTLGAMVKRIKPSGRLQLAQLGSYEWTALENENVTIDTQNGAAVRGTILFVDPSYHVHPKDSSLDNETPDKHNIEVRLDARTSSAEETRALGIEVGDFVHFDPRFEMHEGFIKSRFLDDKACLACVFTALKAIHDSGHIPAQRTTIHIGNYEEVCHGGASGLPQDAHDVLAIDVAPIGNEQNSSEYSCSLCLLDTDGPYDKSLNRHLRNLAASHNIDLRPDLFPQFSSDAKANWMAGADCRAALIGPGVDNTHGYERTHLDALVATTKLIAAFIVAA